MDLISKQVGIKDLNHVEVLAILEITRLFSSLFHDNLIL